MGHRFFFYLVCQYTDLFVHVFISSAHEELSWVSFLSTFRISSKELCLTIHRYRGRLTSDLLLCRVPVLGLWHIGRVLNKKLTAALLSFSLSLFLLQDLVSIKSASNELKTSKKLARVLEVRGEIRLSLVGFSTFFCQRGINTIFWVCKQKYNWPSWRYQRFIELSKFARIIARTLFRSLYFKL